MLYKYPIATDLNRFWGTTVQLCEDFSKPMAWAVREYNQVRVNPLWLRDSVDARFGPDASIGILAHEWGHMVQGNVMGAPAELQADCLAGVFLKGRGLPWPFVEELARAAFAYGDESSILRGHGTPTERVNASRRGYYGYFNQVGGNLVALCPLGL
jgi:hypothetical protein